jgi:hypothetical protein
MENSNNENGNVDEAQQRLESENGVNGYQEEDLGKARFIT